MKYLQRFLLALSLFMLALPGFAASSTATFTVTGTVVPTCTVAATAMNFGATIPTPIASNVDVTGTVTATCSAGAPYTVALNVGTGAGATFAARRMTSAGNTLIYSLY